MKARLPIYLLAAFLFAPIIANAQAAPEKNKIICDHAAPPRGMHYVCKSQCDCHLEGKLKNDEDGVAAPPPQSPPPDLKIITHVTTEMGGGPSSASGHVFASEDILYMHGEKIRREIHAQLSDGSANEQGYINSCDTHSAIELDPQRREYRLVELGEDGLAKGWQKKMTSEGKDKPSRGGTVELVTENIDTQESETILGHLAHHWITRIKKIPGSGACTTADETEVDGWYIDYKVPPATCSGRFLEKKYPPNAKSHAVGIVAKSGCMDRFTFTGEQMRHGVPVRMKQVTRFQGRMPDGKEGEHVSTTDMEVTDLSTAPIDPKTFEAPAGYKRVARLRTDGAPLSMNERLQDFWEQVKIALGTD